MTFIVQDTKLYNEKKRPRQKKFNNTVLQDAAVITKTSTILREFYRDNNILDTYNYINLYWIQTWFNDLIFCG